MALQDWVSGKVKYRSAPSASAVEGDVASVGVAYADAGAGVGVSAGNVAGDGRRASASRAAGGSGDDSRRVDAGSGVAGSVARDGQRASGGGGNAAPVSNYPGAAAAERAATAHGASQAAAFSPATAAQAGVAGAAPARLPGKLTIRAVVEREPIEEELPVRRSYTPWVVAGLAILAIGWGAVRLLGGHSSSSPPSTTAESTDTSKPAPQQGGTTEQSAPDSKASKSEPAEQAASPAAADARRHSGRGANPTSRSGAVSDAGPGSVAHEEIPVVPRTALATIHGRIKVVVRVTADESGNVISDNLDHPGPSRYFSKLATQAASKWKFVPDGHKSGGVWLIHFEFARTGVTAHATGAKS